MSKFETSKEMGVHQQLNKITGKWKGTTRTWFEADVLADESETTATIRPVLEGRFVVHEYTGTMSGKPLEGMAIFGYDLSNKRFECAWIDSFHMSTGIMLSQGNIMENTASVLGKYASPEMPEPWGWRTTIDLQNPDELVITAYNISPEGEETKAVETVYKRVQ